MQKKNVTTPNLEIAYLEDGPQQGPVTLLLHGWPDDATTWEGVMPLLAAQGYRVIAPWLRGYGNTRLRRPSWLMRRTGNSGVLALDAIALLDVLNIKRCHVIGHDWGVGIAESLAVAWPERVDRIALLSSPLRLGGVPTPPFRQDQRYWYHWFQATKRGRKAVCKDPIGFSRLMWDNWSPPGWYDEATFQRTAESWKNPDFAAITLHSYQARWEEALPAFGSLNIERKVLRTKTLSLPAMYIQGEADGVNPPEVSANVHEKFIGPFERVVMPGVGHFPSREAPEATAGHLLRFLAQ